MSEQEFQAYMSGEITSVSAWESALVACEGMHQLCEHLASLKGLTEKTEKVQEGTRVLREEILKLREEITEKVSDVLDKTPLIIKPRKTPNDFKILEASSVVKTEDETPNNYYYLQNLHIGQNNTGDKNKLQLNITPCTEAVISENAGISDSLLDSGLTPEESNSLVGLSKINYDIDFSDLSGENSVAELTPEKKRKSPSFTPDPFSPVGSSCPITQSPLIPLNASFVDSSAQVKDDFVLPFRLDNEVEATLLDKDELTTNVELPSPIKPTTSQYSGFSKQGWQIPSIPCVTGDFSSLNASQNEPSSSSLQNK